MLSPQTGDILIFSKDAGPINASYFLGDGFCFEKPGQDFYEPYRVSLFSECRNAWHDAKVAVWRKASE